MISVIYCTGRKRNEARWFFESLRRENGGTFDDLQVIVVDFWAEAQRPGEGWSAEDAKARRATYTALAGGLRAPHLVVTAPAGNPWQGPHRRTRENFYAKSNALNTGVMYAAGAQLLFLDDLSVLSPGFLRFARAADAKLITAFAYDKRVGMRVENGALVASSPPPGVKAGHIDHRRGRAGGRPIAAPPEWTYGGALLVPLETALAVNGWPQDCDGMRSQDCAFGIVAGNAGFRAVYDPRAVSIESADGHSDLKLRACSSAVHGGRKRLHVFLERCRGLKRFPNYYGDGGLRAVRAQVLAGARPPVIRRPHHDWFGAAPLATYDPGYVTFGRKGD